MRTSWSSCPRGPVRRFRAFGDATRLLSRRDYHKSLRIRDLTRENVETVKEDLAVSSWKQGRTPTMTSLWLRCEARYLPYMQGILLEDGRDVAEHSPIVRALSEAADACLSSSRKAFVMRLSAGA